MMQKLSLLLLITLLSCSKSDSDPAVVCTLEFIYGLNVVVRDADTLVVLTDQEVSVTATDGSYTEALMFNAVSFLGAGERPGNYVLTASGANYQTYTSATIAIIMDDDVCHVIPAAFEILIQPN